VRKTTDKEKALRDLLKLLADHPELADRITITIRPSKVPQDKNPEQDPET